MSDQLFCRFCGEKMPADSQFCPHCGKSQSGLVAQPSGGAAPSHPPNAEQGTLPANGEVKKGGKIPLFVWVIGAAVGLCCSGLAVTTGLGTSFWQSAVPTQTAVAVQTGLAEKWTTPFLALYIVEQQYRDSIATLEKVEAGSLTRDEFTTQFGIPDAYDVAFLGFFGLEDLPAEVKTEEDVLKVDPSVQPFLDSLKDDFENVTFTEMEWMFEHISLDEAVSKLREGQQALSVERERMIQTAKSEGMTDEVYVTIQTHLEGEWPRLKEKFTDLGIRMMTPEP